jgi:hypothetical protein
MTECFSCTAKVFRDGKSLAGLGVGEGTVRRVLKDPVPIEGEPKLISRDFIGNGTGPVSPDSPQLQDGASFQEVKHQRLVIAGDERVPTAVDCGVDSSILGCVAASVVESWPRGL